MTRATNQSNGLTSDTLYNTIGKNAYQRLPSMDTIVDSTSALSSLLIRDSHEATTHLTSLVTVSPKKMNQSTNSLDSSTISQSTTMPLMTSQDPLDIVKAVMGHVLRTECA
jgi:hypothetical protein